MKETEIHILEADSVELSFGDRAVLRGAYASMRTGEVTALLGRNGEGKSCLMRIIGGRLKCDFKSMRIDSVWRPRFSSDELRYLPQGDFIPPRLRTGDVMRDFGVDEDRFYCDFPSLGHLRNVRVGRMSGGERRLVGFYAVVRSDSMFVMLDEPFSQVMPVHIEAVKRIIREERERKGILLSDHMFRHVADCADGILLLSGGTVRRIGSEDELVRCGYLPRCGG